MTLHEAIELLLKKNAVPMTTIKIAEELNENKWYQKKDRSLITAYQIHGRTKNYPNIFDRDGSLVLLKTQNIIILRTSRKIIEKVKNVIPRSISPQQNLSDTIQFILANFIENFHNPKTNITTDITQASGNYLICLRIGSKIPGTFPTPIFKKFENLDVIYTGITGDNLRDRYKKHFEWNNAGRSTLRKSLGVLFGYKQIPRDKDPNTSKTKFNETDELKISDWMRSNLLVYMLPSFDFKNIEVYLIDHFNPPFNLDKNRNVINADFRKNLKQLRADKN